VVGVREPVEVGEGVGRRGVGVEVVEEEVVVEEDGDIFELPVPAAAPPPPSCFELAEVVTVGERLGVPAPPGEGVDGNVCVTDLEREGEGVEESVLRGEEEEEGEGEMVGV